MKTFRTLTAAHPALLVIVGALAVGLSCPSVGEAQDKAPDVGTPAHSGHSAAGGTDLPAQLRELKAKLATLEAALEKSHPGAAEQSATDGKGMGMMGKGGMGKGGKGMGMMGGAGADDDELTGMMEMMQTMMQMKMMQMENKTTPGGMSGMPGKGMDSMSGTGMGMMGMEMMGGKGMGMMGGMMKGTSGMQSPSALPGFPGASHIYHIGATGFFLDHPEHIQLTSDQQAALNRIKEKALLDQGSKQREIDGAEQQLWTLTASDQPVANTIEAKVREIEGLRGDQRLAFIRSVGEAAKVLTDEQRQILLGTAKADSHIQHAPAAK